MWLSIFHFLENVIISFRVVLLMLTAAASQVAHTLGSIYLTYPTATPK